MKRRRNGRGEWTALVLLAVGSIGCASSTKAEGPTSSGGTAAADVGGGAATGSAADSTTTGGGGEPQAGVDDTSSGTDTKDAHGGDPGTDARAQDVAGSSGTDETSGGRSASAGAGGEGQSAGQGSADDSSAGGASGDDASEPDGGAGDQPGRGQASDADCATLVTDDTVNWRESALSTDQEIVECLATTLGSPIGFGEKARGGYDPDGGSRLIVIQKDQQTSVEAQVLAAISGDEPAWIVFDKRDFAEDSEIGLYRAYCDDAAVLSAIDGNAEQCRHYESWCDTRGYSGEAECLDQFFNVALNDGELPIRNPVIGSNKTIDGRGSRASFLFSGFAIGSDSDGSPVETSESVILTHLTFRGAGHTEDHELDPDMIRSTGASHDIWIHKNDFDLTGDSAFDVKVGAYDISVSFNRVVDVLRASLHGSSDSRTINEQITTTIHHNAFVTRDERYLTLGNTGRRVPLIRRGTSHIWNNAFVNYRKDVLSIRVGASVLWENNAFVVNEALAEKSSIDASLDELSTNLMRDVDDGNLRTEGTFLWFSDASCLVSNETRRELSASSGSVADLAERYDVSSRSKINEELRQADQALVDYISATAGKFGQTPFNSPLSQPQDAVLESPRVTCQR